MAQQGYVDTDGARLYYEAAGTGEAVVLIHTGNGSTAIWDGHFEALARQYHVIRYDLRGFGRSTYPGGPFLWARDLYGLLSGLGVERAHVVGASLGGRIGLELSVLYPQLVSSLTMAAPVLRGHQWSEAVTTDRMAEWDAMMAGDYDKAFDIMARNWVSGPYRQLEEIDPALVARVRASQLAAYEVQRAAMLRPDPPQDEEELDPPAADRLAEVRVPTLVIAGGIDQPDAVAIAHRLAAGIPNARLVVFEDAAHMVTLERPDDFLDLALTHLGG